MAEEEVSYVYRTIYGREPQGLPLGSATGLDWEGE